MFEKYPELCFITDIGPYCKDSSSLEKCIGQLNEFLKRLYHLTSHAYVTVWINLGSVHCLLADHTHENPDMDVWQLKAKTMEMLAHLKMRKSAVDILTSALLHLCRAQGEQPAVSFDTFFFLIGNEKADRNNLQKWPDARQLLMDSCQYHFLPEHEDIRRCFEDAYDIACGICDRYQYFDEESSAKLLS